MDVVHYLGEMRSRLHENGLIPSLKQMPALATESIEPRSERALQPVHALHQVRPRRLKCEVIVVSHQRKRMQLPSRLFAGLEQTLLKRLRCYR